LVLFCSGWLYFTLSPMGTPLTFCGGAFLPSSLIPLSSIGPFRFFLSLQGPVMTHSNDLVLVILFFFLFFQRNVSCSYLGPGWILSYSPAVALPLRLFLRYGPSHQSSLPPPSVPSKTDLNRPVALLLNFPTDLVTSHHDSPVSASVLGGRGEALCFEVSSVRYDAALGGMREFSSFLGSFVTPYTG